MKISRIEVDAPEREAHSQREGVVSGNQGGVWGTERFRSFSYPANQWNEVVTSVKIAIC